MTLLGLNLFALLVWFTVLILPWQAHRTRERLEATDEPLNLDDVSVLIPARNEARGIAATLAALAQQGAGLDVLVVDDRSDDGTPDIVRNAILTKNDRLTIRLIEGAPLPPDWGGKLWALEQGLEHVTRRHTLLMDADIVLAPGMVPALVRKSYTTGARLVSIMAQLRCQVFWERLLVPPFIYFFKLLYPFARVNDREAAPAAAAGGCILVETDVLRDIGAFKSIRDQLIDDCALARRVKDSGQSIWLGLSRSVQSTRAYESLGEFWQMVSRTAFTQLHYSVGALLATTSLMIAVFILPLVTLAMGVSATGGAWIAALLACLAMSATYMPVVRFYRLMPLWVFTLPIAAGLYLLMTWSSAIGYWRGTRATWKNRVYGTTN